ncbi:MAG TPA: hypothetical protein VHT03_09825 [Rhizomicrobium sp.]|jgi:hypothetical protein|nr:hypothetical protein [Rhizomicrobium sp.]
MGIFRSGLLAAFGVVILLVPAEGAVLVPVSMPNSFKTKVFGINDNNVVAGSFIGKGGRVEHAFFGAVGSDYSTFDGGTGGSQARGINNNGLIAGFSNSQGGGGITGTQPIFERLSNGTILNVTASGQQLYGRAQGINVYGKFAGTYWSFQEFEAVAFLGRKGNYLRDVPLNYGHQASDGEAINDENVIVGQIFEPPLHGFILDGKTLTIVDYPSTKAQGTGLEGINNNGQATGQWTDNHNRPHGFLYDVASQTFTDILVPGATKVEAWNINNNGAVAVSSNVGAFIWCAKSTECPSGGTFVAGPMHRAPARRGTR